MSMGIGGSASASVGADGSASAGGSIGSGIGGTLAGALGGSLSAGIGMAGGLALSAAANFAANLSFNAGFSASFGAPAATPGTHPPDIYPLYKFMVQFQSLGPMRFQGCGPISATQGIAPNAPPASAGAHNNPTSTSGAHNSTTPATSGPSTHASTSTTTTNAPQGGQGGATKRLPSGVWTWSDITLTRGMAKDGIPLLTWIMGWLKGDRKRPLDLTVILLDLEGIPAMTWHFKQTFPTQWSLPPFSASSPTGGGLVIESLKLAFDGSPEFILT
jgi:phage tail-like protein